MKYVANLKITLSRKSRLARALWIEIISIIQLLGVGVVEARESLVD